MANILKILHPFIPFFTESLWTKNTYNKTYKSALINAHWLELKKIGHFTKSHNDIKMITEIISSIRSTKSELNIPPKLFCNIIFSNQSKKMNKLIRQNIEIIKQVGRVNDLLNAKRTEKNIIQILILKEKIELQFNEDIDISSQKNRISDKLKILREKINKLNTKLQNKPYIKNAPKEIVQNDKDLLTDLTIEENKLRSIVSSIN